MPDEFELDFGPPVVTVDQEPTPTPAPFAAPGPQVKCPGCGGSGRYVGLREVEDPCRFCGGKGEVAAEVVWDDLSLV